MADIRQLVAITLPQRYRRSKFQLQTAIFFFISYSPTDTRSETNAFISLSHCDDIDVLSDHSWELKRKKKLNDEILRVESKVLKAWLGEIIPLVIKIF